MGVELRDGFQLEAADFRYEHGVIGGFHSLSHHGHADVSNHLGLLSGFVEDLAGQSGGGGLTVGSGDGHVLTLT